MTRKKASDAPPPPAEFTTFVRRIGIDSFDQFAQKKLATKNPAKGSNPLQTLANLWLGLTAEEKKRFFDQVIAAGQAAAVAAPAVLAMAKSKTARKQTAKDDPPAEQVAEQKKAKKGKKKKTGKTAEGKKDKKSGKKKDKKDDKT